MGSVTTFLGRFENNYDGELRDFWFEQFEALPPEAQILDLGTGNGALALLAAEYAVNKERAWQIAGVDSAKIDPMGVVAARCSKAMIEKTRFLSDTPIEATGLPEASIDLAMSQFGFEYAEPEAAVAEVARIMKPSGRFVAMVHVENSVLHKQALDGISQVDDCLASNLHEPLVRLVRRVDAIRRKGKNPADDKQSEDLRAAVNEITGVLHEKMEKYEDPAQLGFYTERSMAVFQASFNPRPVDEKLAFLQQVEAETRAYQQRMEDLKEAALTQAEVASLDQALSGQGFTLVDSARFQVEGLDFCHKLIATKST